VWDRVAGRSEGKALLTGSLRVALRVDEPTLAAMLLAPFRLEMIAAGHSKALGALVGAYGERWAADLIVAWSARLGRQWRSSDPGADAWIASLPQLCSALRTAGDPGAAAARLLVLASWARTQAQIDRSRELASPSERERTLSALGRPLAAILEGGALVDAVDVRDAAVEKLCGDESLLACATAVLRATPVSHWPGVGLDPLATHCRAILADLVAHPERAADDWSIDLPEGCECDRCAALRAFLAAPSRRTYEWPLAKDGRRHVHGRIDAPELPVRHQTRRVGRPYTLILTKTDALFEREAQQRRRAREELAWLTR
jgi:hypothetical protein